MDDHFLDLLEFGLGRRVGPACPGGDLNARVGKAVPRFSRCPFRLSGFGRPRLAGKSRRIRRFDSGFLVSDTGPV